jgi:hypothetical protein
MFFVAPPKFSKQYSIRSVLNGAEVVIKHCTPNIMQTENFSFSCFQRVELDNNQRIQQHPVCDFYHETTTDFCKSNWKWKIFQTALRQVINELFEQQEIQRLPEIMVSPQTAYHSSNVLSDLTVGKISRWTHLLDTCLNSVAQVFHHAKADRSAEVGGKPVVKTAMLQCLSALLHDAAVYLFSHTGENALRERGIGADHDAVLLLLVVKLSKSGVFERVGLTKEEVLAAVFPPHFADLFLNAKSQKDLNPLKELLLYWKDGLGGISSDDIDQIIDLDKNHFLRRDVKNYLGTARYVHNVLDNISYIPTDQGHHSRPEMLALMACDHGQFIITDNCIALSAEDIQKLPADTRKRMAPDREYFFDKKILTIGGTNKEINLIIERRKVGANRESQVDIPIFIKETTNPKAHWIPVKIGKALLAKEECLRSTWATLHGTHDCVTSSVNGLYRIIKGQFDYARRKVTGISAAMSSGFWERMLSSISFDPKDFLRLVDKTFILKYFPTSKAKLIVGPSPYESQKRTPRGYDADIRTLLRLEPKTDIDWFKERPSRESVKVVVAQINQVIEEFKRKNNIPASEDCYAALATSINKEFEVQVVGVKPGTAFEFLKSRSKKGLERIGSTVFLKPLLRKDDTFSSRLIIEHGSFEGAHSDSFDFRLEEFLLGALTVCVSSKFVSRGTDSPLDKYRESGLNELRTQIESILQNAQVTTKTFDGSEVTRPLMKFFKFVK